MTCFAQQFDFVSNLMIQTLTPLGLCLLVFISWKVNKYYIEKYSHEDSLVVQESEQEFPTKENFPTIVCGQHSVSELDRNKDTTNEIQANDTTNAVHDEGITIGGNVESTIGNRALMDLVENKRNKTDIARQDSDQLHISVLLLITFFILPSVSTTIFSAFPCLEVNPDGIPGFSDSSNYLAVDFQIVCNSQRYNFGVAWAAVMIVIYPVGIPVSLLFSILQLIIISSSVSSHSACTDSSSSESATKFSVVMN